MKKINYLKAITAVLLYLFLFQPMSLNAMEEESIEGKNFMFGRFDFNFHMDHNTKSILTAYHGILDNIDLNKLRLYLENKYKVKINFAGIYYQRATNSNLDTPKFSYKGKMANYYWDGGSVKRFKQYKLAFKENPILGMFFTYDQNRNLTMSIKFGTRYGNDDTKKIKYVKEETYTFNNVANILDFFAIIDTTYSIEDVYLNAFGSKNYKEISVDKKDYNGYSPLYVSTLLKDKDASLFFIDQGDDVNFKNEEGGSILKNVIRDTTNNEVLKKLFEKNVVYTDTTEKGENLAYYCASFNGSSETMQLLIDHGLSVKKGNIFIMAIDNCDNPKIAEVLVKNGASLNTLRGDNLNALMMTSKMGFLDVVKAIVNRKELDINAQDDYGQTALYHAALNDRYEIVKYLLENGADPDITSKKEFTPLMAALNKASEKTIMPLLESTKNLDYTPASGWNALMFASRYATDEIVQKVINKTQKYDTQTDNGYTSLMMCLSYGKINSAKLLIEKGANTKLKNKDGWNAKKFVSKKVSKEYKDELEALLEG